MAADFGKISMNQFLTIMAFRGNCISMMDRGWDLTEMEYPVSNADIVGIYSITHDVAKI